MIAPFLGSTLGHSQASVNPTFGVFSPGLG